MKKLLHKIAVKTRLIYLWRVAKNVKNKGLKKTAKYFSYKVSTISPVLKLRQKRLDNQLNEILEANNDKPIILSLSFIDWDVPLYQRPQHVAIQLAKQGFLYFYHTRNYYDFLDGYKKIGENMYLTNRFDDVYEKLKGKKKFIHLYSTNMYEDDEARIERALDNGDMILYEYIDEISEKISGRKIPQFVLDRHERLLKDEEHCYVIATADKLYKDVAKHRRKNFKLVTNGVVYEHFRDIENMIPKEMEGVVSKNKPIIGYYGALASWFDYELLKGVAREREDWSFVLIGWDYDGSFKKSGLDGLRNVFVVPPVDYHRLPLYAQWFDVCMIPFQINDVTKSTSPVKLFEYMALGKPIVTTPMPECKKYKSVIIANNDTRDFMKKVEEGLRKREDGKYLELLKEEALENTWEKKAEEIREVISKVIYYLRDSSIS